jgi:FlaA1/EpsC-like NDP-sugar epimerase
MSLVSWPQATSPDRTQTLIGWFATKATRVRADLPLALLDVVLVVAALGGMLTLRFDGAVPAAYWARFVTSLPLVVLTTLLVNWLWGLYGQVWRHASVLEARRIILSGATTGLALCAFMTFRSPLLPRSVVGLGFLLYTVLAGAVRFQSRLFALRRRMADDHGMRVLILGAGEAGAALIRDMLRSPRTGFSPVAILDDDRRTHGRSCLGVRIVGSLDDLPRVAAALSVHQAILAIGDPSPELARRTADLADVSGVPLRVLPGIAELVKGEVRLNDLRELRIEDLLGRRQVPTDLAAVRSLLSGRRVLVTGAGGSIGSEIARQVAACEPAELLVLDHDETHLHELCASLTSPVVQLLADVRDRDVILRLFERYRPEIVFHAAAHKHVPVLETHPAEAVRTNVIGTVNVVDAATAVNTERFVFISTDKAVRPSCVMGASKRLGEQLVLGCRPPGARFCAVRFGNVLASRGSVIPTFVRQVNSGGPVTITDPRMTRFFMSIREAVQLVLQAAAMSDGGEVFILEMGNPVRIIDLAERMIRLAGRRAGDDVEIRVTGIRPGEKLVEELHTPDERLTETSHPSVRRIRPVTPPPLTIRAAVERLVEPVVKGDDVSVRTALFRLVTASDQNGLASGTAAAELTGTGTPRNATYGPDEISLRRGDELAGHRAATGASGDLQTVTATRALTTHLTTARE